VVENPNGACQDLDGRWYVVLLMLGVAAVLLTLLMYHHDDRLTLESRAAYPRLKQ
jgi:hypothetical protein